MRKSGQHRLNVMGEQLENLEGIFRYLDDEKKKANNKGSRLEHAVMVLERTIALEKANNDEALKSAKDEANAEIKSLEGQITSSIAQIEAAASDSNDKRLTEELRANLERQLAAEISLMKRQVADKEREKVIETHDLSLNISKKIEETKVALQDLKKEQLETTRRYPLVSKTDRPAKQPAHRRARIPEQTNRKTSQQKSKAGRDGVSAETRCRDSQEGGARVGPQVSEGSERHQCTGEES